MQVYIVKGPEDPYGQLVRVVQAIKGLGEAAPKVALSEEPLPLSTKAIDIDDLIRKNVFLQAELT